MALVFLTRGPQGPQGPAGPIGPKGDTGERGETGAQGVQGEQGERGFTGPEGPQGPQGIQGETGPQGPQGPVGAQGVQGETGPAGPAGPQGVAGPEGPKGDKGDTGDTGPAGPQGETGPEGPAGPKGDKGDKGDTGATGPEGPQGVQGPQGSQGIQGPKGDTGETGPQGPAGVGVPSGGSDGQVLAKDGTADYATKWINPPSGGGGLKRGELVADLGYVSRQDIIDNLVPLDGQFVWLEKTTHPTSFNLAGSNVKVLIFTNSVSMANKEIGVSIPDRPSLWFVKASGESYVELFRVDTPRVFNSYNTEPVYIAFNLMNTATIAGTVYVNNQTTAFNDTQVEQTYGSVPLKTHTTQVPSVAEFGAMVYKLQ